MTLLYFSNILKYEDSIHIPADTSSYISQNLAKDHGPETVLFNIKRCTAIVRIKTDKIPAIQYYVDLILVLCA